MNSELFFLNGFLKNSANFTGVKLTEKNNTKKDSDKKKGKMERDSVWASREATLCVTWA